MALLWVALCGFLLFLSYLFLTSGKRLMEQQGITYIGIGLVRLLQMNWAGKGMLDNITEMYEIAKKSHAAALFDFGQVNFIITDLEQLKDICIKDFDHFQDRRRVIVLSSDAIVNRILFILEGEEWKSLRQKMSVMFTLARVRKLYDAFNTSSRKLVQYILANSDEKGDVNFDNASSKITMDVTASHAFGIDSKAFDQVEPSLFEEMGLSLLFAYTWVTTVKLFIISYLPILGNFIRLQFFNPVAQAFFRKVATATMRHRENTGERREDFLQILLDTRDSDSKSKPLQQLGEKDAKKDSTEEVFLDDETIVAQCILFILGGYDNIQSLILFTAYSLALNPDIQNRLFKEISENSPNGNYFDYDTINNFTYLEMIIQETLRLYPPATFVDRQCVKDYKLPGTNITIKEGNCVTIPIIGIQRDEKHFPEPCKFDPERFSAINSAKRNPITLLTFGAGPRSCLASRYAKAEGKVVIAHLVQNFVIEPCEKTVIPMEFGNGPLKPKTSMWLKFTPRKTLST